MADLKKLLEDGERRFPDLTIIECPRLNWFERWKKSRADRIRKEDFIRGRAYSEGYDTGFKEGFDEGATASETSAADAYNRGRGDAIDEMGVSASSFAEGYAQGVADTKETYAVPPGGETAAHPGSYSAGYGQAIADVQSDAEKSDADRITDVLGGVVDALGHIADVLADDVITCEDQGVRIEIPEFISSRSKPANPEIEAAQTERLAFVIDRAQELLNNASHAWLYGFGMAYTPEDLNQAFDDLVAAMNVLRRADDIGPPDLQRRYNVAAEFLTGSNYNAPEGGA